MTSEVDNLFPDKFEYLQISINDTADEDIISYFPRAIEFIEKALSEGTGILGNCTF